MLKPLKGEVTEFLKLLGEFVEIPDDELEDATEQARSLLERAFTFYANRENHGVLFQQDDLPFVVSGFSTTGQATKWAEKQGMKPGEAVLCIVKTEEQV